MRLSAEAEYSVDLFKCYGSNSFSFVNATKIYEYKVKDFEKKYPLYLGRFFSYNIKNTGLNVCSCDFSADYKTLDTSDIIDIYKYLMKKHNMQ